MASTTTKSATAMTVLGMPAAGPSCLGWSQIGTTLPFAARPHNSSTPDTVATDRYRKTDATAQAGPPRGVPR